MKTNPVAKQTLDKFIFELKGFFDRDFCKRIIEATEESGLFEYEYAHIKRENHIAILEHSDMFTDTHFDISLLAEIKRKMQTARELFFYENRDIFAPDHGAFPVPYEMDIFVRKYGGAGSLRHHFDSTVITALVGLNDDYDGGELSFWGDELKHKLPSGSILIFPGNFMYSHNILPIKSGHRYALVAQWMTPVQIYKKRKCDNGYYSNGYTRNGKEIVPTANNPEQSIWDK